MKVIVAEKDLTIKDKLVSYLAQKEFDVIEAVDFEDLKNGLQEEVGILILDPSIVGEHLHAFHKVFKSQHPNMALIVCVKEEQIRECMALFKADASDYLTKPIDTEKLEVAIQRGLTKVSQEIESKTQTEDRDYIQLDSLPSVKKHPLMKKALGLVKNVSATDITILISGESGVGKEIFARALHSMSLRSHERFVGLNCASVPGSLLEAELFGSEKGAFTGAMSRRIGKFELAQNGTLLLDEISEMDLVLQAKLLRVIQEKELYRVGGEERVELDVRLIATTNRNLRDWVKDGNFREDLFYRLNVISIHVPPLRERLEDVPVLAEHFINNFNKQNPGRNLALTIEAIEQLCRYPWPGNIRELENILTRTAYLTRGKQIVKIYFDEGHDPMFPKVASDLFVGTIDQMERHMIKLALEMHDGNRVRASDQLGISVRTLRNKLRQYREEAGAVTAVDPYFLAAKEDGPDESLQ